VWHAAVLYERQSAASDQPSKDQSSAFLAIQLGGRHQDMLKAMAIQFVISESARTYDGTSHIYYSSEPKKQV
jgi:lipid A disaccharide synthetase